jgi:hypothetical protein
MRLSVWGICERDKVKVSRSCDVNIDGIQRDIRILRVLRDKLLCWSEVNWR